MKIFSVFHINSAMAFATPCKYCCLEMRRTQFDGSPEEKVEASTLVSDTSRFTHSSARSSLQLRERSVSTVSNLAFITNYPVVGF
jgi:hypothetical protein